ncbi:PXA domain-containing protein [Emericellopsis atlantica]|uniref:PXA domain-containing protein n=1 Tax=Emericellopsis atlantica TaxID=2614577 RepID=A0A9P8CRT2_9HYPO|nr:PXA domain-containing protein [Emericellopsis atlantica]KAG9257324.1 PXA domain-containing protein [Emericellopsis atlantica]
MTAAVAVAPSPANQGPRPNTNTAKSTAQPPTTRHGSRQSQLDPLSDRATAALIRRTLCTHQHNDKNRDAQPPIDELLPPLSSRNDVDLQLYAFLAIILRDFVQTWYSRITTDEAFILEIVHTVAHCTRALEQRFRKVDLESLLLDELPDLLDKHITAYRTAHTPMSPWPVEARPRQVYHSLCPLPFMEPVPQQNEAEPTVAEQEQNESAYRQLLVQVVLTVLLPTEDLENPCLTSLVGQIFSELIIGNIVAKKAAQPWMLWEAICIVARVVQEKKKGSTGQDTSGSAEVDRVGTAARGWSLHGVLLALLNAALLFVTWSRSIVGTIASISSLPPRSPPTTAGGKEGAQDSSMRIPILDYSVWSCAGNLLQLPVRMPWLNGFLSLAQYGAIRGPGEVGRFDGPLDRLLSYHIQSHFSPSQLPTFLRMIRGVLFPNNAPGKSTLAAPESDAELLALRRRAASALWGLVPRTVGRVYLGGRLKTQVEGGQDDDDEEEEKMIDEVEGLLMVLDDEYCNKHLLYGVLELVLVRLMPELRDKGVEELWEERLGS